MIYSFSIFDRHCNCIYNRRYLHDGLPLTVQGSAASANATTRAAKNTIGDPLGVSGSSASPPSDIVANSTGDMSSPLGITTTGSGDNVSTSLNRANSGNGGAVPGYINKHNDTNASKLLFGIMFSLKNLTSKLGDLIDLSNTLKSFSTENFRVHFMESATGLKFVIVTDNEVDNLQHILKELYTNYYLNHVVYNALSPVEFGFGEEDHGKINNSNFITETDAFLTGLSVFK